MNIERNKPLAPLTTFGLGGPAERFMVVRSEDELRQASEQARDDALYLLGGGSNLLVHDDGVDGLVVANRMAGISFEDTVGGVLVTAEAGVDWDDLVARTVEHNLQGIECLSGIPGTVGAAPAQNIGAYGQSIADTLRSIRALDRDSETMVTLTAADCGFGYRRSVFQTRGLIVTSVSLLLKPGGAPLLKYQDLQNRFSSASPSLSETRRAVLDIRGSKGALAMDGYPRLRSAGSFFRNPVIGPDAFEAHQNELEHGDARRRWFWPQEDGTVKVAAGRLIEGAGFTRGYRDGAVGNSPYHSLTLVAYDGARAADIIALARRIQETVRERFGVLLDVEPRLWGWREHPLLKP